MRRTTALTSLAAACAALPLAIAGAPAQAAPGVPAASSASSAPFTFAIIGDLPYSTSDLAALPGWIRDINAAKPRFTVHVGDIKSGSSRCDTSYFQTIRSQFDTFAAPLVYAPGDNEWTDCHRTSAGAYNPLERLATIRSVFFDRPGTSLGVKTMAVNSQVDRGFPENVTWSRSGVAFAAVNVVGSNNDLYPWSGLGNTTATPEQEQEQASRMAASIDELNGAFKRANASGQRAVVIFLQADMFDPTYTPTAADISAFTPFVQTLVKNAAAFPGETYLINGDSHIYNADRPLAAGSVWLDRYQVQGSAERLQRVTVDGSSNAHLDFLRATINPVGSEHVLGFDRVPYTAAP